MQETQTFRKPESARAVQVDSQTNTQAVADLQASGTSQPTTQTLKTYRITLAVRSESGGPPTVRVIQIKAGSKTTAETLAFGVVAFLDAAQVQSITTEYKSALIGSGAILTIGPAGRSKKPNGSVWTPREIGELLSTHGSINNVYRC